jgi:hypothetical protein
MIRAVRTAIRAVLVRGAGRITSIRSTETPPFVLSSRAVFNGRAMASWSLGFTPRIEDNAGDDYRGLSISVHKRNFVPSMPITTTLG